MDWETTYQYNAGLDAGLWNDRVTLTFDAYLKRTQDLLTSVTLPYNAGAQPTNGLAQVIQNIGDVENKGIELGINSTNVQAAGDGFSWTTQFNFTLNRNRVLDIGTLRNERGELVGREILDDYSITRRGAPLGSFYGFVVAGIFQNATEISQYNELDGMLPRVTSPMPRRATCALPTSHRLGYAFPAGEREKGATGAGS